MTTAKAVALAATTPRRIDFSLASQAPAQPIKAPTPIASGLKMMPVERVIPNQTSSATNDAAAIPITPRMNDGSASIFCGRDAAFGTGGCAVWGAATGADAGCATWTAETDKRGAPALGATLGVAGDPATGTTIARATGAVW